MKRFISVLMGMTLVLFVGSAFGDEMVYNAKYPVLDPDSMINCLDPSNAPTVAVPAHRGLFGLTEEGLPGAGGWAAGGLGENADSLINDLDPSNAPAERIARRMVPRMETVNRDSFLFIIDPSE